METETSMATGRRHGGYGARRQRLGRLLYECRRAEGTETEDGPQLGIINKHTDIGYARLK